MKKRIMALCLSLVLVVGMLAACGGSGSNTTTAASGGDDAGITTVTEGVLTVAMECAYAPYNWTQSDDSNGAVQIKDTSDYAYGYDVMMAKYLADELGLDLQIVKMDWDSLPLAVQSSKVDCVIAGQSITSERLETVDFTDPYYYASIVTLTKKDSAYASATGVSGLAGATATSQINTVWYDVCIPQIENVNQYQAQEDTSRMLVALDAGAVDIVVTDAPTAMGACAVYSDFITLDFSETDDDYEVSEEEINIGISLKKGNDALCAALNEGLAKLTVDDFNDWMNQAIEVQPLSE